MTNEQQMVKDFHRKFDAIISETPTFQPLRVCDLRYDLIDEELEELAQACNSPVPETPEEQRVALVKIADALGDLLYVVYGAGVTFGIDLEPVFAEIHRSNMTKLWEDGLVHYREDGKILKPPTYERPNLQDILFPPQEVTDPPAIPLADQSLPRQEVSQA